LRADRALDGVAVDIEAAVTQEALESLAPALGIADRFGKSRLAGDTGQFLFPEWPEVGDDRGGSFLTRGAAKIGIMAPDSFLNLPQLGHPLDGFARHVRDTGHVQFVKLASHTNGHDD
jgi:hypothetical protein